MNAGRRSRSLRAPALVDGKRQTPERVVYSLLPGGGEKVPAGG